MVYEIWNMEYGRWKMGDLSLKDRAGSLTFRQACRQAGLTQKRSAVADKR